MKVIKLLAFSLISFGLIGCAGVKFAPAAVNEPIPDAFSKRALYPAGVAGYEFQDLVGSILSVKNKEDPVMIGMIRPEKYKNSVTYITDSNNYYHSRIQKGAEVQGSYLAFAGNFSAGQMAELTLIDIARAGIVWGTSDAAWEKFQKAATEWVNRHPKADNSIKRLWVKSVVLSRRLYSSYTNVGADATGQVGHVIGVESGVYRKSENESKSVMLAFEAFDIDSIAQQSSGQGFSEVTKEKILESSIFTGVIEGSIQESNK